ncbi:hypothetical protein N752_24880 [Desulforamulus aquiferis]|nr:hypothetical protein N752_24880 [Desulforamulus aquiferis]
MINLMEACCSQCKHTPATPCQRFVDCRKSGPFCHESKGCADSRKKLVNRVQVLSGSPVKQIIVCGGTGCSSSGSAKLAELLTEEIKKRELSNEVLVKRTSCHGFCENGPIVHVKPESIFYTKVKPGDVNEIVSSHLIEEKYVEGLMFHDPDSGHPYPHFSDIPFMHGRPGYY